MIKKILFLSFAITAAAVVSSGCSVDKVDPPPVSSGGGSNPATILVSLSASSIASGGTSTVTATVMDSSSRVISGVNVSFAVISATAGSFSPASAVSDAAGQAVSTFTAGASINANATIRASVTVGTGTITGSAPIVIGTPPQVPTSLVVSLGTTTMISNGGTATITATVSNANGPISGATVVFSSPTGTFATAPFTTDASGVASATFTATTPDVYATLTATVGTLSNNVSLQIGTPPPPVPASCTLTINPLQIAIMNPTTVSVTLLTSGGAAASGSTVTLSLISGATLASFNSGTTQTSISLTTNASGIASAVLYSGSSSGTVQVQAAVTGYPALTKTATLNITSNPSSISVNAANPNLSTSGQTLVSATVLNIMNNPVSDGTAVTFAITAGATTAGSLTSGSQSGSSVTATTVNGVASVTFNADPSNAGSLIITASAGSAPVISATTLISVSSADAGSIIFVEAVPSVIGLAYSGVDNTSEVRFKVLDTAGLGLSGRTVNFELFGPTGASLSTLSAPTNADGEVLVILSALAVPGPCRIVATTLTDSMQTLTTSSGSISIGGGVPSDRFLSVSVSKFNLDGLGCNNLQSTLAAYIADRFGNYNILQGTSVSFATDAGAIDASNVTDATGITTSVFRTQDPRPTDVEPMAGEPFYTSGTRTYNPRDGWLTILVSTTGEEYFDDASAVPIAGNGMYDAGEPYTDLPEPYIDSNDNGARDVGELFFDWPAGVTGNTAGLYSAPNNTWDSKIPIFRHVNLVMTGPPNFGSNTTHIESDSVGTGPVTIPAGGSEIFYVYVSDVNMNPLIQGTKISAAAGSGAPADIELTFGTETWGDMITLSGPAFLVYTMTNTNTTGSPVITSFSVEVDWPGSCGRSAKYTMTYPNVTLQ